MASTKVRTAYFSEEIPENALLEIKKDKHSFLGLNGNTQEAQEYIVPEIHANQQVIKEGVIADAKDKSLRITYDNFDDSFVKEQLFPHLHIPIIRRVLDSKNDTVKCSQIISTVIKNLEALNIAEAAYTKITTLKTEGQFLIDDTSEILTSDSLDKDLAKKAQDAVRNLAKEIASDHAKVDTLTQLIATLKQCSLDLVNEGEVKEMVLLVEAFVKNTKEDLEKDTQLDPKIKAFFEPEFQKLEKVKTSGNPYAMKAAVEAAGKLVFKLTSKEERTALSLTSNGHLVVARFILGKCFGIDERNFTTMLGKINSEVLNSFFTTYKQSLGWRSADKSTDLSSAFKSTLLIAVGYALKELEVVHAGGTAINIELSAEQIAKYDKVITLCQTKMLGEQTELSDTAKRLAAIQNLLKDIKKALTEHYEADGMAELEIKDIVNGPAFIKALQLCAEFISGCFSEAKPEPSKQQ